MVVNTPSNTASLISMAITDIILLLIMLVGLLRLRRHSGGTFGLARLLLKQVWCCLGCRDYVGLWVSFFRVLSGSPSLPSLKFRQQ